MNYLHSCIMLNKILSSDDPSGIQSSLISNMYNYILMNIAHLLGDSFRNKSKAKFIGELTEDNTL